jgi:hypothetical protein
MQILLNNRFLTSVPGTKLWDAMKAEDRMTLCQFPGDWSYFTSHLSYSGSNSSDRSAP